MAESDKDLEGNDALWGGRFEEHPDEATQRFGASLPVDRRMWKQDIKASQAHARMLGAQGVLDGADVDAIVAGLDAVGETIAAGTFAWNIDDEDIHMSVESQLTRDIGEAGGRLHTGRSRNDQVATDTRLYMKDRTIDLVAGVIGLQGALMNVADAHFGVVMPGYTHMQRAQPVLFSHHMMAYFWMLSRDFKRLVAAYDAADASPLGSAALAGTTYPLDRQASAADMGFSGVIANSMDAVSDRDFLLDLDYACSVCMIHLSRMCEELILWSTGEFGFITLSDAYSTGSSIMPQKKNPDFAELVRGKTGRVVGDLVQLLMTMKSLPLAYKKDMQEDKEGVFDAVDTLEACLACVSGMVSTMRVNADRMRAAAEGGFMAATDLADYLVGKGIPFRKAHEIVGELVLACEKQGRTLQSLTAAELAAHCPEFGSDATNAVDIDKIVARRTTEGGTGHEAVKAQMEQGRSALAGEAAWLSSKE